MSRGVLRWEWVALSALAWAALLLLRSSPIHPGLLLLPLLLWPFAGAWRWTLLASSLLGLWMAWSYTQLWNARITEPLDLQDLRGRIAGPVEYGADSARFDFQPENSELGRLRVGWYRNAPELLTGDCWHLSLRLRPPRGSLNPGGLDYEAWLFRQRITGLGTVKSGQSCERGTPLVEHSRQPHWEDSLQQHGSARAVATLQALLFGQRDGIRDEDWTVLRRTGTSHLFAISGLHVGLIAALAYACGMGLWRLLLYRWWPRAVDIGALCGVLAAIAYAALSGFGLPAQRAAIMCVLGLLAVVTGRQRQMLSLLSLALVVVVALDPLAVLAPGFWLSFIAVLGIVCYLQVYPKQSRLMQLLGMQLLLTVLLMPLTLFFFGGVSWVSVFVNAALVPLFGLILPALFLVTGVGVSFGWQAPLSWAMQGLDGLWAGLDAIAAWEWAYQDYAPPSLLLVIFLVLGVLTLLRATLWVRIGGMALLIALSLQSTSAPEHGQFRLWVWDVGQGLSVLIQTADHAVLYDAGPAWPGGFNGGERIVVPALKHLGLRQLDALIVSHGDMDHAGGADAIASAMTVLQRKGYGGQPCRAGQGWIYDDVEFNFLHPTEDIGTSNNQSCVLRVMAVSGRVALLPGDIEALTERALLSAGAPLKADLLLVPHHGSNSSSTTDFLAAVAPTWAIASAGYANRWGFPRDTVRARYTQQNVELWESADRGAIRVDVGEQLSLSAIRDEQHRLWRYRAKIP